MGVIVSARTFSSAMASGLEMGGQSLAWSQWSCVWKTREKESGLRLLLSPKRCKAIEHSRASTGTCVCVYTARGKNQ